MTSTVSPPRAPASSSGPTVAQRHGRRPGGRRRLVGTVAAVVLVLLVATAVWLVYFSSVLATRSVVVSGNRALSAEQVTTAAAVPLGRPLARQALDDIARRATALPQVSAATVTREWPGTVRVTVTERQALLGITQPGGFLVADKAGVVFAAETTLPVGVVQVSADPANRPLLVELGSVVGALPQDVRDQVTSIEAVTPDSIRLRTVSGVTVEWGDSSQSELKAQVATALLASGVKTSIDVSAPHAPATR